MTEQTGTPLITNSMILGALSQVFDPEIGIDIVSLGLIYDTDFQADGVLVVNMTMTTPYCPFAPQILSHADAVCREIEGVKDVQINLVWSPPWDPRVHASDEAKLELGIY